jgi:hypothetical protein
MNADLATMQAQAVSPTKDQRHTTATTTAAAAAPNTKKMKKVPAVSGHMASAANRHPTVERHSGVTLI